MWQLRKLFAVATVALLSGVAISAQDQNTSAYFLDGYAYRHEFNPAFASARSYLSLPALADLNVATRSKMGISTFFYPTENGLSLFTSSKVSANDFLSNIQPNNKLNASFDLNLLSLGFWGKKGGFFTVGARVRANMGVNLPGDLFEFAKEIGAKDTYNIAGLGLKANAYAESYLGYSRQINDKIRVGAKVKVLLGLANANLAIEKMQIQMNEAQWSISANGVGAICAAEGVIDMPKAADGNIDYKNVRFNPSPSIIGGGFGVGFDIGVSYEVMEGLTVNAALLDLGSITWNNCTNLSTGDDYWQFDGFSDVSFDESSPNSISNQFNTLTEDMKELIKLKTTDKAKLRTSLPSRINVGAEYQMPFYKALSVGALYTQRFDGEYSTNDGRIFCTLTPTKWFSISGNYGLSESGSMLGAAFNLHASIFNIFFSTDSFITQVTPPLDFEGVKVNLPVKGLNTNVHLGLVVNLSKRLDKK